MKVLSAHSLLCRTGSNVSTGPAPSLLVVVIDTNPHAWALLEPILSLPKAISNLLVFINAHLAFNAANSVAVIASHSQRAVWLYPQPASTSASSEDVEMSDASGNSSNANKYLPFARIETALLSSIRSLLANTTPADISSSTTTAMAGALTLALSYINKASLLVAPSTTTSAPSSTTPATSSPLASRILILSVSGDLAHQYIPIMNSVFAAQRLAIPIDILKLAGDSVFLQQASDTTSGIYLQPSSPQGLLLYLMMAFLPDRNCRKFLVSPTAEFVDFRAACFCHRKVVNTGLICTVCLSSTSPSIKRLVSNALT